jgi:hypothetical protein
LLDSYYGKDKISLTRCTGSDKSIINQLEEACEKLDLYMAFANMENKQVSTAIESQEANYRPYKRIHLVIMMRTRLSM